MFNFFSSFKKDVINAFTVLHARLAAIENKLDTLFSDRGDTPQAEVTPPTTVTKDGQN